MALDATSGDAVPASAQRGAETALRVFVDVMKELPATLLLFDTDTLALVGVGLLPVLPLSRTLRAR